MKYTGSVPVRQPEPELPDHDLPSADGPEETHEGGGNSVAYFRLLWEHRGLLSRLSMYGLLASTLIAFLIPSRYESTARLMPPDNQGGSGLATAVAALSSGVSGGNGGGGLGAIAGDLLGSKSTSELFVGILSSRTVKDKLIQQFDLKKIYWDRRMEDARKDLADHTTILVDRKSQIIAITVTDKSPQRAAAMAQAYVEELNRLVSQLSTSSARRERIFLEGRLQAVNQDLEAAENDFSHFASKNTAIDIKEQGKAMVEAAALLQGQLVAAESEYEGLRQIYADNNVRLRSVRARIDELKHQLEKLGGKNESATNISNQPNDSMYPSIRKLPLLGVEYADLYRRAKIQEAVLETLTKQYELAKVQEAKEIPTVKVLDAPNVPDKKSFPPRLLFILMGTVLAFAIGSIWVFVKTTWERTDSADPAKLLAHEVFVTFKAKLPKFARNGSVSHFAQEEPASRFPRGGDEDESGK